MCEKEDNDATIGSQEFETFLDTFDPLAILDREYAAVLNQPQIIYQDESLEELDGVEEREFDELRNQNYALIPDESDSETEEDNESDVNHDLESVDTGNEAKQNEADVKISQSKPVLSESSSLLIRESMKSLQLAPPPWAKDRDISDQELMALAQETFHIHD